MKHATPEEIVAFRDRELTDPEVEQHIRTCPLCRRQLGEARYVRTHICSELLKASGPTPSRDEIAAYLDEALNEEEMARVEIHIRGDDNCLAVFDQLLSSNMGLENPIPRSEHVEQVKERLRGPRLAGRLRIFITDRFKQVFHPDKTGEFAFGRAMKMELDPDAPLPCMEAPAVLCQSSAAFEGRASAPPRPPGPSKPRLIDSGRWLIRAVSSGKPGDAFLDLAIEDGSTGKPVPGLPVTLEPGWDDPVEALTDEAGKVRFPLPDGESILMIGNGPDLVINLEADIESEQQDN